MSLDALLVGLILAAALGYLLRRALRARRAEQQRGNGCDHCGH
jgi:hypothetical protein